MANDTIEQGRLATKARRQQGSGTVRERSPGHWELRVYDARRKAQVVHTVVADPSSPRRKGIPRAVQRALDELKAEVAAGKALPKRGQRTLSELLEAFIAHRESVGRSPTTTYSYRVKARRIAGTPLGKVAVATLTAHDLDREYEDWRAEGMSQANLAAHHRVLRAALTQGMKWGWTDRNVALLATVGNIPRPQLQAPRTEELRLLIERAEQRSPDLAALLVLGALTGARRGELCALRWSDVDWAEASVTFRRTVVQVGGRASIRDGLKAATSKTVALDARGTAVLQAQHARAEETAQALRMPRLPDNSYIFASTPDGSRPMAPDTISHKFRVLCRELEAETGKPWRFRWHDATRRYAGTTMIALKIDPRTAAGRLGHADPSTTLRLYADALKEGDRAAAELLGQQLAPLPSVVHP